MISKILSTVLFTAGVIMLLAGLFYWPEPSIVHIVFGTVAFLSGLVIFFLWLAEDEPKYDERTGRYYRYAKKYDDYPHHGYCPKPKCSRYSPTIIETHKQGYAHIGIGCEIHGCQWTDDGKAIEMASIPKSEIYDAVCKTIHDLKRRKKLEIGGMV